MNSYRSSGRTPSRVPSAHHSAHHALDLNVLRDGDVEALQVGQDEVAAEQTAIGVVGSALSNVGLELDGFGAGVVDAEGEGEEGHGAEGMGFEGDSVSRD